MGKYHFLFKNSSLCYNKNLDSTLYKDVFFLINLVNFIFLFNNIFNSSKKTHSNRINIFNFANNQFCFNIFKKNNSFFYKYSFFFFFRKNV